MSIKYRKEIDGLRFIAVTSVILYHAGLSLLPGGYLGVDIFFVISGFLITLILLRESQNKTFSIVDFYERRFRRIIPALFTVTMVSAIPAVFLLAPTQLAEFGRSLVSTALFVSNFLFAHEVDYFSNAAELKPLIHTWSLAVEEQFYIFFPLLLWWIYPRGTKLIMTVITIGVIASLAAAQYGHLNYPGVNFFLTTSRIWELGIGCLAAVIQFKTPQKNNNALSFLGLIMILVPMAIYGHNIGSPTLYTAIPVVGAALVLLYGRADTFVGKALSWKPFVAIGLISYSAYLWHQPLLAYGRLFYHNNAPWYVMAVLSVMAYVLAWFTWKFIENPPRRTKTGLFSRKMIFVWSALTIIITVIVGLIFATGAIKSKVKIDSLLIDALQEKEAARGWYLDNPALQSDWASFSDPSKINVVIVGDSHSIGTFNMLHHLKVTDRLPEYQFIRVKVNGDCLETGGKGGTAQKIVDYCMGTLANVMNPDVFKDADIILYSYRWRQKAYLGEYVPHLVAWGHDQKIRSVFLSSTPEWKPGQKPPEIFRKIDDEIGVETLTPEFFNKTYHEQHEPLIDALNKPLKKLVTASGALYLEKQDYACLSKGKCFAVTPNMEAIYTDVNHMTRAAARFYADRASEIGWFDPVKAFYETPLRRKLRVSKNQVKAYSDELEALLGFQRSKVIEGTSGADVLRGTKGDDNIRGLGGDDELFGGKGNDTLNGGIGNDIIHSGQGKGKLYGGKGDDVFYLTSRSHQLVRGGSGADRFIVENRSSVTQFIGFNTAAGDRIDVSSFMTRADFKTVEFKIRGKKKIFKFRKTRFIWKNALQNEITEDAFIFKTVE